ncbi:Putative galacturan 1,4-alpha-galacturonidase [Sparassis crispa]|uniref:galacturonan 1,4-alpha-galacturonidase n=1 Tax=Sparassis crispa TaxID=139825 RepID=A0A401GMP8_9APHY|nr:Putative galacturan 1,4-alpha-galacturonidase [Sparassis crispa]GBE83488.1 Putative galacturan 1,4-alpha-galacturonidase [Sparassis crispa]
MFRSLCTQVVSVALLVGQACAWASPNCSLSPLGAGQDDTDQIEAAIKKCGHGCNTVFAPGEYNITRKMTWNLQSARVDLEGYLNFKFDLPYWMDPANTYRVIFIQSQASWFVITGNDFIVDAHNMGGIIGNGQQWWSWYGNASREDGDGRPVSLSLVNVTGGTIKDFRIDHPPFWCNAVVDSKNVVYDGMWTNASNSDPLYFNQNVVPNTDGIDTYRSDNITLINWDITSGDDCIAIKGNSTNIYAKNITCRGGNGIAFGSLGQYANLADNVNNVVMEDLALLRPDPVIQPNMIHGVYFKSWTGTRIGFPPTGGGGGPGLVTGIEIRNMYVDNVTSPVQLYQTNSGLPGDAPSELQFENLSFSNITGTALRNLLVDIRCSPDAPCPNITFSGLNVTPPNGESPAYNCYNVVGGLQGLSACNATDSS